MNWSILTAALRVMGHIELANEIHKTQPKINMNTAHDETHKHWPITPKSPLSAQLDSICWVESLFINTSTISVYEQLLLKENALNKTHNPTSSQDP